MNVGIALNDPRSYQPYSAIILYGHRNETGQQTTLATEHDITLTVTDGSRLGPGRFVTKNMVERLLASLNRGPLTIIPPHVVATAFEVVAWYEPAQTRTLLFESHDPAVQAFDNVPVPQPALLFVAGRGRFQVYALASDERPSASTKLYSAPYFNIFDGHDVCIGSMKLPDEEDVTDTNAWSTSFFRSNFTALNGSKRWRRPGTYAELLRAAQERGSYDPAWLLPLNLTMEQALCGNSRSEP